MKLYEVTFEQVDALYTFGGATRSLDVVAENIHKAADASLLKINQIIAEERKRGKTSLRDYEIADVKSVVLKLPALVIA